MTNTMLTITTPGKLMLAGEWNIVTPTHHCIAIPTQQQVITTLHEADTWSYTNASLQETLYGSWQHETKTLTWNKAHAINNLAMQAITTTLRYLACHAITIRPLHITTDSQQLFINQAKMGLGSSAAVTVGIVRGLLTLFMHTPSDKLIFKLAHSAHAQAQGGYGSGFDIAIATMKKTLWYQRPQTPPTMYTQPWTIDEPWPYLTLQPYYLPKELYVSVAFCGISAATPPLLERMDTFRQHHNTTYHEHMLTLESIVQHLYATHTASAWCNGIRAYRRALNALAHDAQIVLEIPELTQLIAIAERYGAAAKLSGAGGGDCAIALSTSLKQSRAIEQAWHKAGYDTWRAI